MPRAQGAGGRERIRDAALALFTTQGYELTSMAQIARAAGVAKSLLHYHFDGKAALLADLLGPYLDAAEAALGDIEGAGGVDVRWVLERYLDLVVAHQREVRLLNSDLSVRADGRLGERYGELQARWRARLSDDEVIAAAALGVLTRPAVQLDDPDLNARRDALLDGALAVLVAGT